MWLLGTFRSVDFSCHEQSTLGPLIYVSYLLLERQFYFNLFGPRSRKEIGVGEKRSKNGSRVRSGMEAIIPNLSPVSFRVWVVFPWGILLLLRFPIFFIFDFFLSLSRIRLVTLFLVLLGRFTTLLVSVPRNGSLRPARPPQTSRSSSPVSTSTGQRARVFGRDPRWRCWGSPRLKWPFARDLFSVEIRVISPLISHLSRPGIPCDILP